MTGALAFASLPPSNMASYINAEGGLNLESYKTRITGSMSYGWLSQNDFVTDANTSAGPPRTVAGREDGLAGLSATTFTADIAGLTRPNSQLALRYGYRAYNYSNDNTANSILLQAFNVNSSAALSSNQALLAAMQYSYFRQAVNLGADYHVNKNLCLNVGYTWKEDSRSNAQGRTASNSPQVGLKWVPADWLTLMTNYTFTTRTGTDSLAFVRQNGAGPEEEGSPVLVPLTYKFYAGSLIRNNFNLIAEMYPRDNLTFSFNFSIYNDNFTNSSFGIQSDQGWSTGVDVSWRPHDRVALSFGYDHQQLQTKELAATFPVFGEDAIIGGDAGPTLTTSDSYDTFFAAADFKLIPNKLNLTVRGSYSTSLTNFHNTVMDNPNEYYADIRTYLTYKFNEHWAVRTGYIYQNFRMSSAYQTLFTRGITAVGANGNTQQYNTLNGWYTNAQAHIVQAFLSYRF